jgi:hypothetical protein
MRESLAPKQIQRTIANDDDEIRINPQNKTKRA